MWILITVGSIALALTLICSVIAAALQSVHRLRDTNGLSEKQRLRFERYLRDPDSLRLTALVGKTASETLFLFCSSWWFFASGSDLALPHIDEIDRWLLPPMISVLALALLAELLPPTLAPSAGRRFLSIFLPILHSVRRMLSPFTRILIFTKALALRVANIQEESDKTRAIAEEILDVVSESERHEDLAPAEKDMIESIVELRDREVSEIMTPRTDVRGIPSTASLGDIVTYVNEVGHSRIPIFEKTVDRIIGIFYVKDMVAHLDNERSDLNQALVSTGLRKPYFIPETKHITELLEEFQRQKLHMAVVLDEYGGTAGIVTLEDVLEEIVGEIIDEYDEDEQIERVAVHPDGSAAVDAMTPVEEINEALGLDLPEGEDFDTIGGFVFSCMGKVPVVGDIFSYEGTVFEIVQADERRIHRLKISPAPTSSSSP